MWEQDTRFIYVIWCFFDRAS